MTVSLGIMIGTILGFAAAYRVFKMLDDRFLDSSSKSKQRLVVFLIATLSAPVIWFIAFIMGGNFGGAVAAGLAEIIGLSDLFMVPLGIATGLAFCIAAMMSILIASSVALARLWSP